MKIYFAGSIRGGRQDKEIYLQLIEKIKSYGKVLTEHIGNPNLLQHGEEISEAQIFKRDVTWISQADYVVAEVTNPSLGVGYEIALAQTLGKPLLILYRTQEGKKLSAMIRGNTSLNINDYKTVQEAIELIEKFFKEK